MSARGSSIVLSKMDTQAENGLEVAKKELSSYLMNLATQRDNSPIIANAILNKNPISTRAGAQVVNISIDISGYVVTLKKALEDALRQHFTGLSAARRALVDDMKTEWDPQSNTLKTAIQIDAPNENAMTAIKESIAEIQENGVTFEPSMTVPVAGPPAPPEKQRDRLKGLSLDLQDKIKVVEEREIGKTQYALDQQQKERDFIQRQNAQLTEFLKSQQ